MKEGRENGQAMNERETEKGRGENSREGGEGKKREVIKDIYMYMHVSHYKRACKITLSRTSLSSAMC